MKAEQNFKREARGVSQNEAGACSAVAPAQSATNAQIPGLPAAVAEALLAPLLHHAPLGIMVLGLNGDLLHANPALHQMLGWPQGHAPTFTDIVFPADQEMARARLQRLLHGQVIQDRSTMRWLHGDGAPVWVDVTAALHKPAQGTGFLILQARDIDARKRAEAALFESEGLFHSVMEFATIGMVLVTPEGDCIRANQVLADMLGYQVAEFTGLSFRHFTHPDDVDGTLQVYDRLARRSIDSHYQEKRYRHRDGHYCWAQVSRSVVRDRGGEPIYIVVQVVDISERKAQESALAELNLYLRMAVDASGIGIWSYDPIRQVGNVDDRVYQIWGINKASFEGGIDAWLRRVHPEDRAEVAAVYAKALRGEAPPQWQHRVLLPSGEVRHLRVDYTVRRDAGGNVTTVIGTTSDITAAIQNAESLRQAKEAAETANRAKTMFLANMSHELRTPLNAIIGFSELLKSGVVSATEQERVRSYANDIHGSGLHLLNIINDLLDLTRIEAGKFSIEEGEVQLGDEINDAVSLMRHQIDDAKLTLNFDIQPNLPLLRADQRGLRQILLNLLSNAVKFTPAGGRIECGAGLGPDGLSFWVADSGIGIAARDIPKLMQPFAQIDNVYRRQHQGAGLGLAIVRALARLHDGEVAISSAPSQGTRVSVVFPASRLLPRKAG